MILSRPLILASKSPRRSQLLAQAGFEFTIQTKEVEETYPKDLAVHKVPVFLAEKKAMACKDFIKKEEIILAADTVVILEDKIYGKPKNFDDAVRILQTLSGTIHQVITGVCLLTKDQKITFSGHSSVHFEPITEEEILYYIEKYQPYDKAGAYAIQEWIGLCKIAKIEGTYTNIMGLPMDLVYKHLQKFDY